MKIHEDPNGQIYCMGVTLKNVKSALDVSTSRWATCGIISPQESHSHSDIISCVFKGYLYSIFCSRP